MTHLVNWDAKPFTRIVEWGRDFVGVCAYILQYTLLFPNLNALVDMLKRFVKMMNCFIAKFLGGRVGLTFRDVFS